MRLQEIATITGVNVINYGEETQARYEIKVVNNMGQKDVVYLRSKDDVAAVVRELMAQDAASHAKRNACEQHPIFARYINFPNPFTFKTTIGTCRKAARATSVDKIVEEFNASHSQVLTINREK